MNKSRRQVAIRPSALLGREGVGAITESGNLSFVIKPVGAWERSGNGSPRLEVSSDILAAAGVSELRMIAPVPDKASQRAAGDGMVPTATRFPRALICGQCDALRLVPPSSEDVSCSNCGALGNSSALMYGARWVAVCHRGHLYDVPWDRIAHEDVLKSRTPRRPACSSIVHLKLTVWDKWNQKFPIAARKPRIQDMYSGTVIGCENCGAASDLRSLSRGRSTPHKCLGLDPWDSEASDSTAHCAWYSLRNSTQIIQPEAESYLDILHGNAASAHAPSAAFPVPAWWDAAKRWNPFVAQLRLVAEAESASAARDLALKIAKRLITGKTVVGVEEAEIADAILEQVHGRASVSSEQSPPASDSGGVAESGYRSAEWSALMNAARVGVSHETFDARPVRQDHSQGDTIFAEIAAVERLREVRIPKGFQRMHGVGIQGGNHKCGNVAGCEESAKPRSVKTLAEDWLPAVESFGEGIFLQLDTHRVRKVLAAPVWSAWVERARHKIEQSPILSGRSDSYLLRDVSFALTHTVSHLLLKEIAFFAGYSLPSLRERLFVGDASGNAHGILIYTSDGDSEGSLGGLVRLATRESLSTIMARAVERAGWCAQDPICYESDSSGSFGLNFAACHACTIIPETSCAHSNYLLNRRMVIDPTSSLMESR